MNGFIYKIYDNTNGNVYYGSTIQSVAKRVCGHRADYKRYLKGVVNYNKAYDILKNEDYDYSVVEEVECENKYELHNRERFYIENNKCVNKCVPNRTIKEWVEDNKDKMKEYIKNYNEVNKDKIKERDKKYREANKDKIKESREANREKIKEYNKKYREANKELISKKNKGRHKKYREANKDKIKEYREANREKIKEYNKKYHQENKELISKKNKRPLPAEIE